MSRLCKLSALHPKLAKRMSTFTSRFIVIPGRFFIELCVILLYATYKKVSRFIIAVDTTEILGNYLYHLNFVRDFQGSQSSCSFPIAQFIRRPHFPYQPTTSVAQSLLSLRLYETANQGLFSILSTDCQVKSRLGTHCLHRY